MRQLLCVGGPLDSTYVTIQNGQQSFIVATSGVINVIPAWHEYGNQVPENTVTVNEAVYKVQKIGFTQPGLDVRVEVLAYYGRDRRDRPNGFYL